jgi:hypothetical protein
VLHATILSDAIKSQLDTHLPKEGTGEAQIVGKEGVSYRWVRDPIGVRFDRGRILVDTKATAFVRFLGERKIPISITVAGEPVVSAEYTALLQSVDVKVKAESSFDTVNHPIEEKLTATLRELLESFRLDARPLLGGAWERIAKPLGFDLAGRQACAELQVTGVEAGPNVFAGGLEKDLGVVILPSVTLPCTPSSDKPRALPPMQNVSNVPSGPFHVTIPIAADYVELSKAMENAMGGQLHFSKEYPGLYLEKPAVYPSRDTVVIKLMLGGSVKLGFASTTLSGELFFSGHPKVIDNQIVVPDLELTPGTADGLLKLKVLLDGKGIRDQAQSALRVDLSERIHAAQGKLGTELSFSENLGCVRAEVLRTEVTGIFPHERFLRIYVDVDGQAGLFMPCPK